MRFVVPGTGLPLPRRRSARHCWPRPGPLLPQAQLGPGV